MVAAKLEIYLGSLSKYFVFLNAGILLPMDPGHKVEILQAIKVTRVTTLCLAL